MTNIARAIAGLPEIKAAKPIPYFAAYIPAPSISALSKENTAGLDGLILSHLVAMNDGSTRVFTYWATFEHFEASGEVLRDRLQAQLLPERGRVVAASTPPKPWWKKVNPLTVVLSIAAAVGALDAISIHYDWLLARPLIVVRPEKAKVDVIESSDVRMAVTLVSQLPRTEHRNIKVAAGFIDQNMKSYPLQLVEHDIAALAGGASKELIIEGTAPEAGEYTFHIDATADAGWWRSARTFVSDARVIVWPKTPRGSIRLVEAKSSWARFVGTVRVGPAAPHGLDCELENQGTSGLKFENQFRTTVGSSNLQWHQAGQLENAISILTWSTTAVTSMQSISAEVILLKEPPVDWVAVSERTKLKCYARQEKVNDKS